MLKGKNIYLRLIERDDLPLLVTWRNKPETWACFFNKFPLSMAGQDRWFANLQANDKKQFFVICLNDGDTAIGTLSLENIDFASQSAELGNVLIGDQGYLGKGYSSQALNLLIAYSFKRLNMNRLWLRVSSGNQRAIHLYEQCGFKSEGTLRQAHFDDGVFIDILIMSLLRQEFLER